MASKPTTKRTRKPAQPDPSAVLASLRSSGIIGQASGGTVPVTFNGGTYPSIRAFVDQASWADLSKVTAADLDNCGNTQAVAVFSRAVQDRARKESASN